jgi:hypothetical protein
MRLMPRKRLGRSGMRRDNDWVSRTTGRWTLMAAATLAVLAIPTDIRAQTRDQPRISVPPTIVAEPASEVLLSIKIASREILPGNTFVRLKGLPPTVSLTEGYTIAPGSWAIPLFGVPTLRAKIPADVTGRGEITITLVAVDGTVIAEAKTALVVATSAMLPPADRPVAEPKAARAGAAYSAVPQLSAETKARAERLLVRGEEYLATGNIVAARDFFERAADAGLAAAALRLATTYDPAELRRLQLRGVVPDPPLARKWYERAQELGAPEASDRLAKLSGN